MNEASTTKSRKTNEVFSTIKSLGLNIESRQGNKGWNRLYLVDREGNRITDPVYYRSNKQAHTESDFKTSYKGSHKDNAMRDALKEVLDAVTQTLNS